MTPNSAIFLSAKQGQLELKPAQYTAPKENEIVVKNGAVAINPVDWITIILGDMFFPWLKYPFVLGSDVAGEVVATGNKVSRFRVGDRVLGHAVGSEKARNNPAEGAFQSYTVLLENMSAPIPATLKYENAVVLPLAISTAACALFQKDFLKCNYPTLTPSPTGKTLLIWGGSTSVGSNAIQLAVAAGYEVITTASPRNFAYVKSLGASAVFDYNCPRVKTDLIRVLKSRDVAGALAIGVGSGIACINIIQKCKGHKFVALATPPVSFAQAPSGFRRSLWLIPTMTRMVTHMSIMIAKANLWKISTKFIWGSALMDNEVSQILYQNFLPSALAEGDYKVLPEPQIVGNGLDKIPEAIKLQRQGVSARKVVVTLH